MAISMTVQPSDQMSAAFPYPRGPWSMISGAMYCRVPGAGAEVIMLSEALSLWEQRGLSHPLAACTPPELCHPKQFPSPILLSNIYLSFLTHLRVQPIHGFHRLQWVPSYNLDSIIYSEFTTNFGPHRHFWVPFQALNSMSSAIQAPVLDSITSPPAQSPALGATPIKSTPCPGEAPCREGPKSSAPGQHSHPPTPKAATCEGLSARCDACQPLRGAKVRNLE